MRGHFAAIACGASAIIAAGSLVHAQRATTERHVFVGVSNTSGKPVEGLTPADFVVREDDIAREVLRVSPTSPPSHVAMLVDNTDEANSVLIELRTSLTKFAQTMAGLPTPPSMSLMTFAERPTNVVAWTTSDVAVER